MSALTECPFASKKLMVPPFTTVPSALATLPVTVPIVGLQPTAPQIAAKANTASSRGITRRGENRMNALPFQSIGAPGGRARAARVCHLIRESIRFKPPGKTSAVSRNAGISTALGNGSRGQTRHPHPACPRLSRKLPTRLPVVARHIPASGSDDGPPGREAYAGVHEAHAAVAQTDQDAARVEPAGCVRFGDGFAVYDF